MVVKKGFIWLIIIIIYIIILAFNTSYHSLSSDRDKGYREVPILVGKYCGAPYFRFGDRSVGTTKNLDDNNLPRRCGRFEKMLIGEAKYSEYAPENSEPYYNIYCNGISFSRVLCPSGG